MGVQLLSAKEEKVPAGLSGDRGVRPEQACCPSLRKITVVKLVQWAPKNLGVLFLFGSLLFKDPSYV